MVGRRPAGRAAAAPDPHHRADARPRPAHAVHHRLRHHASTSTARAGACCWACPTRTRRPGFKLDRVRRLAAAARRGHRAPGARASAEVGIAERLGRALRDDPGPQRAGRRGGRTSSRFLYATGFSGHGFLMGPAIGEVMRDLYLGRPPVVDVSGLDAAASPAPTSAPSSTSSDAPHTNRRGAPHDHPCPPPTTSSSSAARARHRPSLRRRPRRRSPATPVTLADQRRAARLPRLGRRGRRRRRRRPRAGGLPRSGATVPAPARGALVKRLGELLRRAQGRPRHPDQPRGRQDHLRGARRGPGDDRHLRLRRRPLPPALRPHDDLRAPGPPADGDLAPARRRRRHQRVQLPGRRLVLEHRHRPGLRRPGGLEAVGAGPADRAGQPRASWPRPSPTAARPPTSARCSSAAPTSGRRSWTTRASPCSARPARPAWAGRSDRASPTASAAPCSSSAATTPRS